MSKPNRTKSPATTSAATEALRGESLAARVTAAHAATNPRDVSTRCWRPAVWDSADGPVVGASYRCDYRYEEEAGVGELRTALLGSDPRNVDPLDAAASRVHAFGDVNGLVVSTSELPSGLSWGDERLGYSRGDHASHFEQHLPYARGADTTLRYETMATLRELAADKGLARPWPRTKTAFANALADHLGVKDPDQWPGWFYDGRHLVLRADSGVAADVIAHLAAAAGRNTLTLAPNSGPFHTGIFLCDSEDIGPNTRAELTAAWDLHDEQMATIAGTLEALKAAGAHVYFLGNPRVDPERGLVFYLNCSPPRSKQVFGWFTAAELTIEHLGAVHAAT